MSDLIERQDAIDTHCELCPDQHICCPVRNGNICKDIEAFKMIPSAQPQRKRGHWIRKTDTRFGEMLNDILICSECGIAFSTLNMIRRSYCPNCGARMVGESDAD